MRYIILALALALPLGAQVTVEVDTTTAGGKSALAAVLAANSAALAADAAITAAYVDSMVQADSLDFSALGTVNIIASTRDSQYVVVDLPFTSTSGLAHVLVAQSMVGAVQDYKGTVVGVGRVSMRKDRALEFLRGLDAALQ